MLQKINDSGEGNYEQKQSKVHYRKVASSNTSGLKAHAGFFRLLMKGILYYVL